MYVLFLCLPKAYLLKDYWDEGYDHMIWRIKNKKTGNRDYHKDKNQSGPRKPILIFLKQPLKRVLKWNASGKSSISEPAVFTRKIEAIFFCLLKRYPKM